MAQQISVKSNIGKNGIRLRFMELAGNELKGRLLRLIAVNSSYTGAGTKLHEPELDQKYAYLEGPTLTRMQILR